MGIKDISYIRVNFDSNLDGSINIWLNWDSVTHLLIDIAAIFASFMQVLRIVQLDIRRNTMNLVKNN